MRDHGGDMDRARALYGEGAWIDLSTGINAAPYPVGDLPANAWKALPTKSEIADLETQAKRAYGAECDCVALAGAQAAIQLVPRLSHGADARVIAPTYNEHAGALTGQGWEVTEVADLSALDGADLAVVVSPNNPDGRHWSAADLVATARKVGLLIVDESFGDPTPDQSILPIIGDASVLVLRSFGKFYGLAGARLGFALGNAPQVEILRRLAGPWAVSGPAISLGMQALADAEWQAATRERLVADCARLDALAQAKGWSLVGGTSLFRTYDTGSAIEVQTRLAKAHIWTRIFPYSATWVRFGLPGSGADWARVEAALA